MEYEYDSAVPIKSWVPVGSLEEGALAQAYAISTLPCTFHHVALMPDCHQGFGMPIGGVLATKDMIVPNAVGMDISCSVSSCHLHIQEIGREQVQRIMWAIKDKIPVGKRHRKRGLDILPSVPVKGGVVESRYFNAMKEVGTLGGGNHFGELQKRSDGDFNFMFHSGSRNVGARVATHYHKLALEYREKEGLKIPKDLAYLPIDSEEGQDYLTEMNWCMEFSKISHKVMMDTALQTINEVLDMDIINGGRIHVSHNFAAMETHFGEEVMVHRKGATMAYESQVGLIPGSQGTNSYVVKGLGNEQSFKSCSHGAGRLMSRTAAKKTLDLEVEQAKMGDIVHDMRSTSKLDEAPGSYKDIHDVMDNQRDLVNIIAELTPVGVMKG